MVQVKPGTYALSPKINGMTLTEFDNYLILKAKKKSLYFNNSLRLKVDGG